MYVACTRAKNYLGLCVPASVYDRSVGGNVAVEPSPFVRELDPDLYVELQESFPGRWIKKEKPEPPGPKTEAQDSRERKDGYCRHRIFGKGKIVRFIPPDKYQVNFSGFGLKVIMGAFLMADE
jgi:DNA helicase-2/ATP-dependent DNA helicase PcrA